MAGQQRFDGDLSVARVKISCQADGAGRNNHEHHDNRGCELMLFDSGEKKLGA